MVLSGRISRDRFLPRVCPLCEQRDPSSSSAQSAAFADKVLGPTGFPFRYNRILRVPRHSAGSFDVDPSETRAILDGREYHEETHCDEEQEEDHEWKG
jgi:hypothetical protein